MSRVAALGLALTAAPLAAMAGPKLTTLYSFDGSLAEGAHPVSVVVGLHGAVYGIANTGDVNPGDGSVFMLTPKATAPWPRIAIWSFAGAPNDGRGPSSLTLGAGGALYGTTLQGGSHPCLSGFGCGTVFQLIPLDGGKSWSERVLYDFKGAPGDGYGPTGAVALGPSGFLYGTTPYGGSSFACGENTHPVTPTGCGTVFQLARPANGKPPWKETLLHVYKGAEGAEPFGGPVLDAAGDLYVATEFGGRPGAAFAQPSGIASGCGDIASFVAQKQEQVQNGKEIINAACQSPKGDYPAAPPQPVAGGGGPNAALGPDAAAASLLIGTMEGGGLVTRCRSLENNGCGVVYKLTRPKGGKGQWPLTVIHAFQGGKDGADPVAGLAADGHGNFYGVTAGGDTPTSFGTIFKLAPSAKSKTGYIYSKLYNFHGKGDGAGPRSTLFFANGALYGTTQHGGIEPSSNCPYSYPYKGGGCGTVFKFMP